MAYQESGREHLSPRILRLIDAPSLPYSEMSPGQPLRIQAQDAISRDQTWFDVRILSVRDDGNGGTGKVATLEYQGGDFNFFDGEDPDKTTQLAPGTLMENGLSGVLLPQLDLRLAYFGGIGTGRDHGFEFVGGKDSWVVAQRLTAIETGEPPVDYHAPDISNHLQKVENVREQQMSDKKRRIKEVDRVVMADMEEYFSKHPSYQEMRNLIAGYSADGKLVMSSYLIYALEDGVVDRAWEVLKKADYDHFSYEHPAMRGNLDIKASSRVMFTNMIKDAGIKWPRPQSTPKEE